MPFVQDDNELAGFDGQDDDIQPQYQDDQQFEQPNDMGELNELEQLEYQNEQFDHQPAMSDYIVADDHRRTNKVSLS